MRGKRIYILDGTDLSHSPNILPASAWRISSLLSLMWESKASQLAREDHLLLYLTGL